MRQHVVARAKGEHFALVQHEGLVERRKRADTVRDDNHDGLARAQDSDGLRQRGFAFRIEICVRLVENDEKRSAIDRPRKPDALALPRREKRAALTDTRAVSSR